MRRFLFALLAWSCSTTSAMAGWALLADAAHSPPDFAFQWMAWDSKRGVIWTNDPGTGQTGTWKFDPATNVWSNVLGSRPVPPGLLTTPGTRHNCGFVYDSKRDRVFISACAPAPDFHHWSYDPAANAWTNHGGSATPGGDVAMSYDPVRDIIIGLGGWGQPGYGTWHKSQAAGLGSPYTLIDNLPPELAADLQSDAGKETMNRAAWDSKRGEMWYVQTNGSLWTYNPSRQVWTRHATTGPKPPPYTVYGHNPVNDVIVGWTGCNGWDCADVRGLTWLLNRTTLVWSLAERASAGDTVPPASPYQTHVMLWDTVRHQMILRTGMGVSNQGPTWRYTMTGTVPPPTAPLTAPSNVSIQPAQVQPPPTTYTLTISKAGTGSGTISGDGTYPSGTAVTMTATPATGSTFAGWSGDADCTDGSVTMTAAKACAATFTLVTSGELPTRQWVAVPLVYLTGTTHAADQTPFFEGSGSKDIGVTFDSQTGVIVYGTGDVSPDPPGANGPIVGNYTYRTATNAWARISDHCPPSGEIPSWPTDRGPYVYDRMRHGIWVWQNPYHANRNGEECGPGRAKRYNGLFLFSLSTRTWTRRTDAPEYPGNQGNAAFDATTNSLLVIQPYACPGIGTGSVITTYNIGVTPLTTTQTPVCITRPPTFPARSGWIPPQLASRNYPAWDPTTRTMYFCAQIVHSDGVRKAAECYKYHRPSNTVSLLPTPPVGSPPQADYYTTLVWDSVSQRVLWPVVSNACAHLQAMLAYNPATNTWEMLPLTGVSPVVGSTIVYDPVANAVVLVGSVFCSDYGLSPGQKDLFLYRYGTGAEGRNRQTSR
jgi:Divergent InlB B-repeat domain